MEPLARHDSEVPREARIAAEAEARYLEEWMEANQDETAGFEDQSPFAPPIVIFSAMRESVRVIERDDRERRGDPCAASATGRADLDREFIV